MEKTLAQLVKEYLAQPLQDTFQYSDIPDVTSTTKEKEEEEKKIKKPVIYVPPSGGGGGGIDSLNPYGGTPIQGGFDGGYGADPISGDLPGGGNIVDEFGTKGDVYDGTGINNIGPSGDLPGGGNLYDEFQGYGPITGGTNLNDFDGLGPITGGTNLNDYSGVGPITGGINLNDYSGVGNITGGTNLNDYDGPSTGGNITGGTNLNDYDGPSTTNDYSDFDDGTMTGSASPTGSIFDSPAPSNPNAREGADEGGGRKIVCTMMNESYGFGSFRNKIWMKFHKDLSPEYQKGYHKLFLPLVRIAKTNKVVKKILEHIAVHSTIDMRQATRGKIHLLGRIYRKILLPLCYIVGKHG